ncbi:MAG: class I SAM-dependent methyltransferase [Deltaproteobacteria bacterium]|nr:class I SAM-dependent methyltransferase [Deltaproteobacteria bacterium]
MTAIAPCRICSVEDSFAPLSPILDLGKTPLANRLVVATSPQPDPTFPLSVAFCPKCSLVQITETVPPETLFSDYLYFSSYSTTMLAHAEEGAQRIVHRRSLGPEHLVVELASNDGYMLQFFKRAGVRVLGVEPAKNIARVAQERGIETRAEFFSLDYARTLRDERVAADVVIGNNVLAHVADVHGFVAGIQVLIEERDGEAVLEFPYVREMIDRLEYDTIYHEHLCYFSLHSVQELFRQHGLTITEVQRLAIHGGSLRITARMTKSGRAPAPSVTELLEEERAAGVCEIDYYRRFADAVRQTREAFLSLLGQLRSEGKRIVGYGAAAKACTLLHFCEVGVDTIECIADRNPHKQGLRTPGTRIPVVSVEALVEMKPDVVVVFPWNIKDEILSQLDGLRRSGTRMLIPLPEPILV